MARLQKEQLRRTNQVEKRERLASYFVWYVSTISAGHKKPPDGEQAERKRDTKISKRRSTRKLHVTVSTDRSSRGYRWRRVSRKQESQRSILSLSPERPVVAQRKIGRPKKCKSKREVVPKGSGKM